MKLIISVLLGLLLTSNCLQAQKTVTPKPETRTAQVDVEVVDEKNAGRPGELVIFNSSTNKKFTARTNKQGKLSIQLPQGADYVVTIKGLSDSSQYANLSIPLLKEGAVYTGPFQLNILYEPAVSYTLDHVEFDVGKASLRPSSFKELMELVDYLKWKPEQVIEIGGHTDNTGNEQDNLKLSQLRAEAVRNFLMTKGIKASQVVAKGYGQSKPIADNGTADGKQKNRRTEVRVLNAG